MMFVWKEQEFVIQSERSYSVGHAPIINEVSRGTDFYTVEQVNASGENSSTQPPMPSVYNMISTVILQNGFQPSFGVRPHI